jgi:hypothetical protein
MKPQCSGTRSKYRFGTVEAGKGEGKALAEELEKHS